MRTAPLSGYVATMATGIVLFVIGAILAFAVDVHSSWLRVPVVGVILMLGGIAFVVRSQLRRREVTTVEADEPGAEETTVVERRVE